MSTDNIEAAIDSLLVNSEEPEAETEEAPLDEGTESEEPEAETEAAESDAEEDTDEEASDEADEEDGDEADEADQKEPELHTVKVDGEEKQVTLDDLKRSYSGQEHIQKGMKEAAETRKQSEELYNALQAAQQKFLESVQQIESAGFKGQPTAPDIGMMDTDPIGYMQEKARYDNELASYQDQQQQLAAMRQQQAQMQQVAQQEYLKQQRELLTQRIPDFSDPVKARDLQSRIVKNAIENYGLQEQVLSTVVDAGYVQALHDALLWRELQASKATAKKAPEAPRNVKPSAKRPVPQNVERKRNLEKARRNGKPEAFIDLLLKK